MTLHADAFDDLRHELIPTSSRSTRLPHAFFFHKTEKQMFSTDTVLVAAFGLLMG